MTQSQKGRCGVQISSRCYLGIRPKPTGEGVNVDSPKTNQRGSSAFWPKMWRGIGRRGTPPPSFCKTNARAQPGPQHLATDARPGDPHPIPEVRMGTLARNPAKLAGSRGGSRPRQPNVTLI